MNDLPVYGIKPPNVSPYLTLPVRTTAEAQRDIRAAMLVRPTRSPVESLITVITPPLWIVVITPRKGDPYIPEMPLQAMRSERSALDVLKEANTDGGAMVLNVLEDGHIEDVSEDFARQYAIDMARDGWDEDALLRVRFLSCRLTNDEIYEICRSR